jgi:hypothetical protein
MHFVNKQMNEKVTVLHNALGSIVVFLRNKKKYREAVVNGFLWFS